MTLQKNILSEVSLGFVSGSITETRTDDMMRWIDTHLPISLPKEQANPKEARGGERGPADGTAGFCREALRSGPTFARISIGEK